MRGVLRWLNLLLSLASLSWVGWGLHRVLVAEVYGIDAADAQPMERGAHYELNVPLLVLFCVLALIFFLDFLYLGARAGDGRRRS